jgi:hypothetical protein
MRCRIFARSVSKSGAISSLRVDAVSAHLLRGDIVDLTFDHAHLGKVPGALSLRDAEVEQLDLPVVSKKYVLRAHVAVHDFERLPTEPLEVVRIVQTAGGLRDDAQLFFDGQAGAQTPLHRAQGLAFEVLHRDEVATVRFADLVRLHDVRMVQARREPSFVEKHLYEIFGAVNHVFAQGLHDQQLVEASRAGHEREIDFGHSALTKRGDQAVLAEGTQLGGGVRLSFHGSGAFVQ